METLDSEPIHNTYTPQLQENSEEGMSVLDTFESEENIQNFKPLELMNSKKFRS
jgi:hypothetical protein